MILVAYFDMEVFSLIVSKCMDAPGDTVGKVNADELESVHAEQA